MQANPPQGRRTCQQPSGIEEEMRPPRKPVAPDGSSNDLVAQLIAQPPQAVSVKRPQLAGSEAVRELVINLSGPQGKEKRQHFHARVRFIGARDNPSLMLRARYEPPRLRPSCEKSSTKHGDPIKHPIRRNFQGWRQNRMHLHAGVSFPQIQKDRLQVEGRSGADHPNRQRPVVFHLLPAAALSSLA